MAQTAKARYQKLKIRRNQFLEIARQCAALTIPSLLPPEGHHPGQILPQPYQSHGARIVVYLASRVLMAMYPPGLSSFRLTIPSETLIRNQQLMEDSSTQQGLAKVEKLINGEIERRQWRKPTHLTLVYLIVTGNALERILPDNTIRVYRLDQYVAVRDPSGNLLELVIEESIHTSELPEDIRAAAMPHADGDGNVLLYTWIKKQPDGSWKAHQEAGDAVIEASRSTYQILPWNALRWTPVIGESYGRGKCEEHLADLRAYDGLSKAALDGSALASRNITMIRPNAAGGLNLRRRLAKANNGDSVVGNPEDVSMLKFENVQGLEVSYNYLAAKQQELSAAFLLSSGARRDAERVTATELRLLVEELEGTLGGAYSMLSQDMQAQRLTRLMAQMKAAGSLPPFPEGMVEPVILTGLEALGREQDVQRVMSALQLLNGLPPEILQDTVNWSQLLTKAFNGLHLPDAVHDAETAAQNRQQRLQQEAVASAAQAGGQALAKQAAGGGGA